ncbi:MAG TPA: hypothetical protein VGG75_21415 [Trebonia sp.]|jgi:hypothetical protein
MARRALLPVSVPVKGSAGPAARGHALESIRVLPLDTERHLPIAPDVAQDPQVDADVDVASITFTGAAGNR